MCPLWKKQQSGKKKPDLDLTDLWIQLASQDVFHRASRRQEASMHHHGVWQKPGGATSVQPRESGPHAGVAGRQGRGLNSASPHSPRVPLRPQTEGWCTAGTTCRADTADTFRGARDVRENLQLTSACRLDCGPQTETSPESGNEEEAAHLHKYWVFDN